MKQLFYIISILFCFASSALGADNLAAVIDSIDIPSYIKPAKFNYKVLITNLGRTSLQNISFKTRVGEVDYDRAVVFSPTLKQGKSGWVEIKNVPNPGNGGFELDVSIIKINNQAVSEPESAFALLTTYSDGFRRRPIIEFLADDADTDASEAFTQYLHTNHKNYPIIRIDSSISTNSSIEEYSQMIGSHLRDNCRFIANRVTSLRAVLDPDYADDSGLDSLTLCNFHDFHDFISSYPAYADIELRGRLNTDSRLLELDVLTEFSITSASIHDFSVVITKDSDAVDYYNYGNQYFGEFGVNEGSFQSFKLGIPCDMAEDDRFDAIALIINRTTGEIVNSRTLKFNQNDAGVDGVYIDDPYDYVLWFTLDGRMIRSIPTDPGVYIRKTAKFTRKVKI